MIPKQNYVVACSLFHCFCFPIKRLDQCAKNLYFSSLAQCCFVESTRRESDKCRCSLLFTSHSKKGLSAQCSTMSGPNTHNTIVSFSHTKATGSIIPRGRERDAKLEIPFIFSGRDFENVIPKAKHVIA